MSKNLHKLVYTSQRNANCTDSEIQNILAACKRNNPGENITGVLIHTDNKFIQVIEGDKDTVIRLYEKVRNDPRHSNVSLRFLGEVTERSFPDWHMGYKEIDSNKLKFNTAVGNEDVAVFRRLMQSNNEFDIDEGMRLLKMFLTLN